MIKTTAWEATPLGICYLFSKNLNARGSNPGGGWALLEMTDALSQKANLVCKK